MTQVAHKKRSALRNTAAFYRTFAKEEDGVATMFAIFMVFMMVLVGGIGVDMMRHEMERTRIQAVADRAVCATTLPNQAWPISCPRSPWIRGSTFAL